MAVKVLNKTALDWNTAIDLTETGVYQAAEEDGMLLKCGDGGKLLLIVKNVTAGTSVLTILAPPANDGAAWMADSDFTYTLEASTADVVIGPFETARYKWEDGNLHLDISVETGVTIAPLELP